ncbi:MAG: GLPGLI family protein [Fluviicola sp.]|nr:GLPGLI family protein [Fluviicola sp.]
MKCGSIILGLIALFTVQSVHGQLVQYGKITYERRTNLYKKFDDERMRQWLKEADKIKTDKFALYFNDSISMFTYITPEEQDQMSWATTKNTVYANSSSDERVVYMDMWGTQLTISDSLVDRTWKITDKTRKIAGYECTRAIWQKDDTTRIYAWFTTDIIPTVGPESVQGLPGAVLGLATEDGGVVFFATSVDIINPTAEQLAPPKKKGKDYTSEALKVEMTEKLKGEPFGDRVVQELFFW